MGPKRNGSQRTGTLAAAATSSIRAAERYEYVLPNSNQNSTLAVFKVLPTLLCQLPKTERYLRPAFPLFFRRSPGKEAGDGLLVPLQADPRTFRHEGVPLLNPDRLL